MARADGFSAVGYKIPAEIAVYLFGTSHHSHLLLDQLLPVDLFCALDRSALADRAFISAFSVPLSSFVLADGSDIKTVSEAVSERLQQ